MARWTWNSPHAEILKSTSTTPSKTRASFLAKRSKKRWAPSAAYCAQDFFCGFAQAAGANVHLRLLYGRSSHHQVEAIFKAFARALRFAATRDPQLKRVLPSTKGLL